MPQSETLSQRKSLAVSRLNASLLIGGLSAAFLIVAIAAGPTLWGAGPQALTPDVLLGPTAAHPLGTDSVGRDVLARLFVGARSSLFIAMTSTVLALFLGAAIGLAAAYFGRSVDWLAMRSVDVLLSMPPLLVAIAVLAALGPSIPTLLAVLIFTYAPQCARVVRGASLQVAGKAFVESARISRLDSFRIIWTHMLPNIRGTLIVQATITVAQMLLIETILSFLGLGVPPPAPNLGFMLSEGRQWMEIAPWVVLAPGLTIALITASFTFLGHGLDEILSGRT